MLDWMSPLAFLQTVIRVLLVWSAFYWVGHMLEKPLRLRTIFPLIPKEVTGIIALMLLSIILSLFHAMNRTVTSVLLLFLGLPGVFVIMHRLKEMYLKTKFSLYTAVFSVFLVSIGLVNLTHASIPNLQFDDPLITYAVQPDRWLNAGRIHWLKDTAFSGFPLVYEITAIWPAALSTDRIDQLSVLQVFQMTILFAAIFRGMRIIGIKRKYRIPLSAIILLCTMLYYWCSLAKTDTAAILFCTLALTSVTREISDRSIVPYSSWLFMGMAIATKQTALLILIPFLCYGLYRMFRESASFRLTALLCFSVFPAAFAIRTFLVTGSPTYPMYQVSSLVKDDWRRLPAPEELRMLNDRDSEMNVKRQSSLMKHIGIFLTCMEGILLLFAGCLLILSVFDRKRLIILAPLILYFTVAIVTLWPPWWGAKYSILIYPSVALISMYALQNYRKFTGTFLPLTCLISFVVPGFIAVPVMNFPAYYRYVIAKSVLQGSWHSESGFRISISTAEGMTHMWLNSYLTEPSVVLSLHEEKRYFSDHEVYVGWRHPATQELYLENTLAEECAILDSLSVDYITVYRANPVIGDMENRLEILDHIGTSNILEPVAKVSGDFAVYRYNSTGI